MKSLRLASLVALALFGSLQMVDAKPKDPSKFYVTMTGHPGHVSGALTDQIMKFDKPVQIPGAVLPAGTYLFQFLTPSFIRVTSPDRRQVFTTFTTIPVSRTVPPYRGQVRFQTLGGAEPLRLLAWYLPGSSDGNQPIYPKPPKSALLAEAGVVSR